MDKKLIIPYLINKYDFPNDIIKNIIEYLYCETNNIHSTEPLLYVEFERNVDKMFSNKLMKYLKYYHYDNIYSKLKEGDLFLKSIMEYYEYLYVHYNKKHKRFEFHNFCESKVIETNKYWENICYTCVLVNALGFKYFEPGYQYKEGYNPNPDYTTELYPIDLSYLRKFEIKEIDNKYIDGFSYSTFEFRDKNYYVLYPIDSITKIFEKDIHYFFVERLDTNFFEKENLENPERCRRIKVHGSYYLLNNLFCSIDSKYHQKKYGDNIHKKYPEEYEKHNLFCEEVLSKYDCIIAPCMKIMDFEYNINEYEYNSDDDNEESIEDITIFERKNGMYDENQENNIIVDYANNIEFEDIESIESFESDIE